MRKTQWFYGYKTAAKAQIKIETQGFDGVLVVLCLEGGVVTQVEAEEMAAIVNDARRDAAKSQLKLRIQLVTMSYSDFVKEYENVPTSLGHARQTTAPVLCPSPSGHTAHHRMDPTFPSPGMTSR